MCVKVRAFCFDKTGTLTKVATQKTKKAFALFWSQSSSNESTRPALPGRFPA